jgi:hypothetical protein
MSYRWPALAALVLTATYAIVYVSAVRAQEGTIAWWYIGALVVAMVALGIAVPGGRPRATLVVATVVLGLSFVVGLLSVGLLLVPALVASVVALVLAVRGHGSRGRSMPPPAAYRPRQDRRAA